MELDHDGLPGPGSHASQRRRVGKVNVEMLSFIIAAELTDVDVPVR